MWRVVIQISQRGYLKVGLTVGLALTCASVVAQPTATILQSTGDKANRVDLFFIGDGYTAFELATTYPTHINNVIAHMFETGGINTGTTNPYSRYQNFFNIVRIDLESNESGTDRYDENDQPIELVDTALNSRLGWTFNEQYFAQLLMVNLFGHGIPAMTAGAADAGYTYAEIDWHFAAVNTIYYGGGGGSFAVFSAANTDANEVALHESGHWNHDLADEYGGLPENFPYSDGQVNLDKSPTGNDWSHWLGYTDPQTGLVDAYEGGRGYDTGVYHPSPDSKMRILDVAFDPIAREKIILDIYAIVDPIDSHIDDAPLYHIDDELWIEVIDDTIINIQWLIDDELIAGQTDDSLDLDKVVSLIGPGSHTLTARAYDSILDHNFSDNNSPDPLDLVRRDLEELEQSISFNIEINWLPGDTDFDGDVDQDDLNTVLLAFGSSTTPGDAANGDLTGDGQINIADLDKALAAWTSQDPPLLVPEPAAAMPLLSLLLLRRRRATARIA